jgi:hypothetical protein
MTDPGKNHLQTGAVRIAGLIIVCLCLTSEAAAQQSKSKRKNDPAFAPKANDYAYETEATTKRKVKQKGQSGNTKFRVEKPRQATAFTPLDRTYDYAKPPYFGHKKPVVIRPAGQQKLCRECGIRH